jgi:hypothetical protein
MPQTIPAPASFEERLEKYLNRPQEEIEAMHHERRSKIIPGRPLPEGKTLTDVFVGCMADIDDDETEILAALEYLS